MPNKRRLPKKRPQITKAEKENFDRFGCSFREMTGVLHIDWRGKDLAQVGNADIFARLVYVKSIKGPILFLACEVSPVRPLPRYCYLPFDLRNSIHSNYLSQFVNTGEIRFRFLAEKQTLDRTYLVSPNVLKQASQDYAQALQDWESSVSGEYDFAAGLQLFERYARIPFFLERVLLEDTLAEIRAKSKQAAEGAPKESRELAARIVREAADAFGPYYEHEGKALFDTFHNICLALMCITDLRRMFADNPAALMQFLTDGFAGLHSQKGLENIGRQLTLILSVMKFPFKEGVATESQGAIGLRSPMPQISPETVKMVKSLVSGIPKRMASKLLEQLGLEVGGQPGRPRKDYARAYELKASGHTWSEVARISLQEDSELGDEFGGLGYDSLDFRQQEALKGRIREGVRSYAERAGKSFPIKPEGEQEND